MHKFLVINQEFTYLLAARILFTCGIKMTPVLLGWYLYELTGSKLSLGILGLSEVVPAILLALPAGVLVDKSDKRALIVKCLWTYLLTMAVFCFVVSKASTSILSVKSTEYIIYLLVAFTGLIRAYISPAFTSIIAQIVKTEELVKAATTSSMSWLVAAITGPFIAGLLIAVMDVYSSFIIVCILILTSIFIFIQVGSKPITYDPGKTKTWESVMEGLHFVFGQKALVGAMGLDMFAVLFGGAIALLPVFSKDILHIGPQGFGLLMSATYIGNFVALLYFNRSPMKAKQGHKLILSVAGFGICILIFGLSNNFVVSFLALLASGLFDGVSMIVRGTIFQIFVPDQMRGRVSSVNSIFINSSNELGQFESGAAATLMGTVPSVIFGGTMTLLFACYAYFKVPALKELEY